MASPASKRTVGDLGWDMAVLRREAYHGWRVAVTGAAVRRVGRTRAVLGFPLGTTRTPACGVRMKPISLVRSALQGDPRGPGIGVQMSARRDVAADCRCDCISPESDNRHPKSRKLSPVSVHATLHRNACEQSRWQLSCSTGLNW